MLSFNKITLMLKKKTILKSKHYCSRLYLSFVCDLINFIYTIELASKHAYQRITSSPIKYLHLLIISDTYRKRIK
jgi:hypothetical protein